MRPAAFVFVLLTAVELLGSPPLHGFPGPAIVMFYGGKLPQPIHLVVDIPRLGIVDRPTVARSVREKELVGRSYVNFAAFWHHPSWEPFFSNPALMATLRPEQGSQHGRIYLPTAAGPAILLSTTPRLSRRAEKAAPVPIPQDTDAFDWQGSVSEERWTMIESVIRPR